jgi:hypothetical protein
LNLQGTCRLYKSQNTLLLGLTLTLPPKPISRSILL